MSSTISNPAVGEGAVSASNIIVLSHSGRDRTGARPKSQISNLRFQISTRGRPEISNLKFQIPNGLPLQLVVVDDAAEFVLDPLFRQAELFESVLVFAFEFALPLSGLVEPTTIR